MIGFLFSFLIVLIVAGLAVYLVRWAVTTFSLPQPIVVVVSALVLLIVLYWVWGAMPLPVGFNSPRLR